MDNDRIFIMKKLIEELNTASELYYNNGTSMMSDREWDTKLKQLIEIEKETGVVLAHSPTVNVGAVVVSDLKKVEHNHPMLSLDKIHTEKEIKDFVGEKDALAMLKLDGLTVTLHYKNGVLKKKNCKT